MITGLQAAAWAGVFAVAACAALLTASWLWRGGERLLAVVAAGTGLLLADFAASAGAMAVLTW